MVAFVLLVAVVSGCGVVQHSNPREVGEKFAETLEGRSSVPVEAYLTPDADVYLQGGLHLSRQAFLDHLARMTAGYDFFHRMSRVYATREGAGWLLDIVRAADAATAYTTKVSAPPSFWMEARIDSGHITRLWVHFTLETLLSIRQSPTTYAAAMAAQGLPMPEGWSNGIAAMLTAAEAFDAQADQAENAPGSSTPLPAMPLTALAAALLIVRIFVAPRPRSTNLMCTSMGARNSALLVAVRARRERALQEHAELEEEEQAASRSVPV
jgi:hypothetical protein